MNSSRFPVVLPRAGREREFPLTSFSPGETSPGSSPGWDLQCGAAIPEHGMLQPSPIFPIRESGAQRGGIRKSWSIETGLASRDEKNHK